MSPLILICNFVKLLPQEMVDQVCTKNQIRFLIIGGKVAASENVSKNQTYPYLTCDSDKIVAPGLRPNDVAPCIKTILGNNIYDAIILDLYDQPSEAMIKLTARLVNRFPKATIINLRQFFPGYVGFKNRKGWVDVVTWARAMGQNSMTKEALELFANSTRPWTLNAKTEKEKIFNQNDDENFIWFLVKDTKDKFNLVGEYWKERLLNRAWMYDDWYVPNKYGHQDIARGILEMMLYNNTETVRSDMVNDWDDDYGTC